MKKSENDNSTDYDYLNTSSATDCTGLIPAAPAEEEELENYEELYPFLPKAVCNYEKEDSQN